MTDLCQYYQDATAVAPRLCECGKPSMKGSEGDECAACGLRDANVDDFISTAAFDEYVALCREEL